MSRACTSCLPCLNPIYTEKTSHYLQQHDIELVGLETAGSMGALAWAVPASPTPFQRIQLLPDRLYDTIPPSEMDQRLCEGKVRTDLIGGRSPANVTPSICSRATLASRTGRNRPSPRITRRQG